MSTASPPASVAVLDSAVTWTHSCLQLARTSDLTLPTPCAGWNLGDLLAHMEDSLEALGEAAELGHVRVTDLPGHPDPARTIDRLVQRACHTRAAWLRRLTSAPIGVGDLALGRDTLAMVGALEIAVHGWDVAQTVGSGRSMPEDLAARLYPVAVAVVTPAERGHRFADAVPVPPGAPSSVLLLGHLGRGVGFPG
jgi:uncharacterized protein (TIGR03086 family)